MPARELTAAVRHVDCRHVIALAGHPDDLREFADELWEMDSAWELVDEMPTDEGVQSYRQGPCETCKPPA